MLTVTALSPDMLTVAALTFTAIQAATGKYESASDAKDYLVNYGYLPPPDPFTGSLVSYETFTESIKEFQRTNGLVPTGEIDEKTLSLMNQPRCGVADKLGTNRLGNKRKKRYTLQGSKWYKNSLTYFVTGYTSRIDRNTVDQIMRKAFRFWTEYTNLTIARADSDTFADILVSFGKASHGDSSPFDGKGGVLAHAFFPERGGDTHFDDEENWVEEGSTISGGIDLLFTATHEFGHSLGLGHSDNIRSIMAPIYRSSSSNLQLKEDDVRAIQSLYGSKKNMELPSTSQEDPSTAVSHEMDLCEDGSFDGITTIKDGYTYIFKGIYYWRLNTVGKLRLVPGYPRRIQDNWKGLRGNIDTVYTTYQGRTFFFRSDKYWEYENEELIVDGGAIADRFSGLPNDLDAVFIWTGNGHTYAIKGADYYKITENLTTAEGYPRDMSVWAGIPYGRITSAINFKNSRTYFFSGPDYYRYNDRQLQVDNNYPRSVSDRWFNCISNIISEEGQYNRQWLEVGENQIFTQTYPPERTLEPEGDNSANRDKPTYCGVAAMYVVMLMIMVALM